jgi:hypothetical protein
VHVCAYGLHHSTAILQSSLWSQQQQGALKWVIPNVNGMLKQTQRALKKLAEQIYENNSYVVLKIVYF